MPVLTHRRTRRLPRPLFAIFAAFLMMSACAFGAAGDTTADAVLGQTNFESTDPNQPNGAPTSGNLSLACFFCAPTLAVAPDGRLYVADASNNRVLSWPDSLSFENGAPADLVFGQPDFESDAAASGATGLSLPTGVAVDQNGNLWVADAFNHRVLKFNDPSATDTTADLVVGQTNFIDNVWNLGNDEDAPLADGLNFPGRVLIDGNDLWIADAGNSRVLHYTNPAGNKPSADRVFGQYDSFLTNAKNNQGAGNCIDPNDAGCGPPTASNLFNPVGIALDEDGSLFVADWINQRVLRYDDPLTSDTVADAVFGQPNFASGIPNNGGVEGGLSFPADVATGPLGRLYIADSGNNRIVVYRQPGSAQSSAFAVLGQLDNLAGSGVNHGLGELVSDADGLSGATGVALDAAGNVFVADTGSSRALRFDFPLPGHPGDLNDDGSVTLDEWAGFVACLDGPATPRQESVTCRRGDANDDDRVDLRDAASVLAGF